MTGSRSGSMLACDNDRLASASWLPICGSSANAAAGEGVTITVLAENAIARMTEPKLFRNPMSYPSDRVLSEQIAPLSNTADGSTPRSTRLRPYVPTSVLSSGPDSIGCVGRPSPTPSRQLTTCVSAGSKHTA